MSAQTFSHIRQIRKDLVAIGPMAPVRAVYEVAKRSGVHGAMLRGFVGRAKSRPLQVLTAFTAPTGLSGEAKLRALEDAQKVCTEGHRAFGTRVPVEQASDWNRLPGTGLSWPANAFWWEIDIRTDARIGDVKWTWEIGRHRDLVVLARAAHLEPAGPWLGELEKRLSWWFEASPSEVGIHWYSNLEVALRIIAWIQIHALVQDRIDSELVATMATQVARAERHLIFDFPYTASSMRNNHLLGDALGLIAIDRFTGGNGSRRKARLAESFFANQLVRHMHEDGSMIEDSLSYHRFVMEMLTVKVMLGDDSVALRDALAGSADHLVRLGVLDGDLPQWGDWDEGRVLASSGDALNVAGTSALALALTGKGNQTNWHAAYDEVAWHAPCPPDPVHMHRLESSDFLLPSGGIFYGTKGDWSVWFKSELQHSHQHADLTHVSIKYQGQWVVVDPGTGTYNGPLDIRNAFRASAAHNGFRVNGDPLLTPHRAFRWLGDPKGKGAPTLEVAGAEVFFSAHDAYVPHHGTRVARAVVIHADGVSCIDWLEHPKSGEFSVALPAGVQADAGSLNLGDGTTLQTSGLEDAAIVCGSERPFEGWQSQTYGAWEPSQWLKLRRSECSVNVWSIGTLGSAEPTVAGTTIGVNDLRLSVNFISDGVELTVAANGANHRVMTRNTSA